MGIDIQKLALRAAVAAVGGGQSGSGQRAARKAPKRTMRDHLPPAWPLVTGAAIAVGARAAIRSRGGEWLEALEERLGVGDTARGEEDREPEPDEPTDLQDEESPDAGAEDADEPRDEADEVTDDDRPRLTTAASPARMSPTRLRKLAESGGRVRA